MKSKRDLRLGVAHVTGMIVIIMVMAILLYLFAVISSVTTLALLVILGAIAGLFTLYASSVIRKKPVTGAESLVGAKGVVRSERLHTIGEVSIGGVNWKARIANPVEAALKSGDPIVVNRIDGLTLVVSKYMAEYHREQ